MCDPKLAFERHIETVLCKTNRTIVLLRELKNLLSEEVLII